MKLTHLTDKTLLADTEKLVKQERELLTHVLHHLREIERRRLYCVLHFSSLYDYAVKQLGFSEDQACRRISAMRLLKEIPELEEKISSGCLNLTHLELAQSFFKCEAKASQSFSKSEKILILKKLENKPKREAEKEILCLSSEVLPLILDKIRRVSSEKIEIKFMACDTLQLKIQKLKGLLAHKNPNMTFEELFTLLCDEALTKLQKIPAPARIDVATVISVQPLKNLVSIKCHSI